MFGTCRKCRREVDGLREELNPEFVCRTCEESPRLTPLQLEFLTAPTVCYGKGSNAWTTERNYTQFEIADLAEIPPEERAYFFDVTIREASRTGLLEKHGTKSFSTDGTREHKKQWTAYRHSSVSRLLVRLRPDLAAGLVAAVFADSTIEYVAIGREWFENFATQLQRVPPPSPTADDSPAVRIRPDDVSHFDRVCRAEHPDAPQIGDLERSRTLGRLIMYRDMLLRLREKVRQSGLFDYGPREDPGPVAVPNRNAAA